MKYLNALLFFGFIQSVNAQTIQQIDSVAHEYCKFVQESKLSDNKKIQILQDDLITPYLRKLKNVNQDIVFQQIYFRMQRHCLEFSLLLDRLYPSKEKIERTTEKPACKLTDAQLAEFKKIQKFHYPEYDGTKTKVVVKNGKWQDNFKDRTHSKLHIRWIDKAEFELEFIESNNSTRKFLSIPGDKYLYQIISKEDKYYWMSYSLPGIENYTKFKLFFK